MTQTTMPPPVIPLHGAPCAGCGRPAHELRLYPHARIVVHRGQRAGACTITGLAAGAS